VLALLSAAVLGLGIMLAKVYPSVTVFQASLIPLIFLVFIGLYVVIFVSSHSLQSALQKGGPPDTSDDDPGEPEVSKSWRYDR